VKKRSERIDDEEEKEEIEENGKDGRYLQQVIRNFWDENS